MKPESKRTRWPRARYIEAAKLIKKFGYSTTYKGNKKNGTAVLKRVKKIYKQIAPYTMHLAGEGKPRKAYMGDKYINRSLKFVKRKDGSMGLVTGKGRPLRATNFDFVFKKLTPKQRKEFKGLFSKRQFTPSGVFIEKPASISPKKFKISIEGKAVKYCYGKCKDRLVKISRTALARDPAEAVRKAIGKRKPKSVKLVVNGFLGRRSLSLKELLYYVEAQLAPQFLEEEGNDEGDFTDTFQLRLIY